MPDYGDDRGFRSRGVPANIGFDRAGPGRNYNEGYRPGDVTVSDQMGGSTHYDPDKIDRFRSEDRARLLNSTPIQTGGRYGEMAPPLYGGRNPFIQPIQTGGRYGEFGGMDSGSYLSSRFGGGLDGAQSERGALLAGEGFGQGDRIRRLEAQGKKVKKILESKYGVNNPRVKQKLAQYFDKMRKLGTGIFQHGVTKGNPLLNIMELLPEGVIEQGFDELNELTDPGVQII